MPEVSRERWQEYLQGHPQSHFLQTGEWGELKSQYGWNTVRVVAGRSGAQVLFRNLPFGLTLAYIPKLNPDQVRGRGGRGVLERTGLDLPTPESRRVQARIGCLGRT